MPSVSDTPRVPSYRHHRPSGQGVVTLNGRDFYLGTWNTKASRAEYDRLIGEWLASGRLLPAPDGDLTVAELARDYWRFAKSRYRKNGRPTSTLHGVKQALRPLRRLYGSTAASTFGPKALKAVRHALLELGQANRTTINKRIATIKRMFRWAVAEELVPPSVHQALVAVDGLRKGYTEAKEPVPVPPVADAVVQVTLPHLQVAVADMVRFERLTGCRPDEVCIIRPCDVDMSQDVWIYRPESHKAEHHGRERIIAIGPKAQDVLRPYLLRSKETYCFVPAESERKRRAERHAQRVTPLSCGNRPGTNRKRRPKRSAGDRYTTNSYRRAIHRAVELANRERTKEAAQQGEKAALLEKWSPNRLRHSAATEIRRHFGLEAAQVTLGHATADVSQIYAERDLTLAVEVMRKIG